MLSSLHFNASSDFNTSHAQEADIPKEKRKAGKPSSISGKMRNRPSSMLSSGPANPKHRTYRRTEDAIQHALFRTLARRDISVRVSHICEQAQISPPTFYLHHRSCNEILTSYESQLFQEFTNTAELLNRSDIFGALLIFIANHRQYFQSCFEGCNFYLLNKILSNLRPKLASPSINSKTYSVYSASITAIIIWWGTTECFSKATIPEYAKQLRSIRITYYK